MPSTTPVQLSIISPVYGCTDCLESLCRRIAASVVTLGISFEIILVDDRGPGNAWAEISRLARQMPFPLRAVRLSRNFGQQMAITAGLAESRGLAAIVLDCDQQDPPEEIPRLYEKYQQGYPVVLTRRVAKKHSFFKRATSVLYTKVIQAISGTPVDSQIGGFSLIDRKVINALLQFNDINRHYLAMIHWTGFETAIIDYDHQARASGQSGYTMQKLVGHALAGLLFYKSRLMLQIIAAGALLFTLGLMIAAVNLARWLSGEPLPHWSATVVGLCTVGGLVIAIQGLIGLYIEQIFEHAKARPLYLISHRIDPNDQGTDAV